MNIRNKLTLVALSIALLPITANAQTREFTSKDGKKMTATLVAAAGKKVTINKGGKEFTVPITNFSLKDQKYLRDWVKNNPNAIRYAFEYDAKAFKQKVTGKADDGYDKVTTEEWAYEVSVTNLARNDVLGVTAEYRIYLEDRVKPYIYSSGSVGTTTAKGLINKEGEAKLPKMAFNAKTAFVTVPHTYHKLRTKSYYRKSNQRDRLRGVWVRLFRDGKKIGEWKSPDLVDSATWALAKDDDDE